jgi:hypothetical protein
MGCAGSFGGGGVDVDAYIWGGERSYMGSCFIGFWGPPMVGFLHPCFHN